LCLELGHAVAVAPVVAVNLRVAFVSNPTGAVGTAGLDAECQAEANAAALPGSYLAAVATTTGSIASRFALTTGWRRVDGTQVSASAAAMFDGTTLVGVVN